MHIVFNHGQESGPFGTKINRLIEVVEARGMGWTSIDYQDLRDEPDARVERLLEHLANTPEPVVLMGSSMGGYVAAVAAARRPVAGLFLVAPALYMGGPFTVSEHQPATPEISVMHGWDDDIIPWEHSLRFALETGANLHLLKDDHSLNSDLETLAALFDSFLNRVTEAGA